MQGQLAEIGGRWFNSSSAHYKPIPSLEALPAFSSTLRCAVEITRMLENRKESCSKDWSANGPEHGL